MNVLENGFGVRTERIRSGSKSKPIRTKKNFLNLSLREKENRAGLQNYGHQRNWKGTKR